MSHEQTPGKPHKGSEETAKLQQVIRQRLGHIGVDEYTKVPRKTKKAVTKLHSDRKLSQREMSRIQALRNYPENPET
jgi:copper oxidase (laccase) domain-containing protein